LDKPPLRLYADALGLAVFAVTHDAAGVNQLGWATVTRARVPAPPDNSPE